MKLEALKVKRLYIIRKPESVIQHGFFFTQKPISHFENIIPFVNCIVFVLKFRYIRILKPYKF